MSSCLPCIKALHLTVNYDKVAVLWDVSFEIASGRMVGVMGPNGAGKSTLLKTVLGLVRPVNGKVEFFGKPLHRVAERIAYVPQRASVDWDFPVTVLDVALMGRYRKMGYFKRPSKADKQAAKEMLEFVGLSSYGSCQIGELSGGQQQRLFIARALLQEADLFFMDEPFAGVDMTTERELFSLFQQLKTQGKTLVLVHHDLNSAQRYFDDLILLNTCLVAAGPCSEVFHPDFLRRTYGRTGTLLDEVAKLSQNKASGLV